MRYLIIGAIGVRAVSGALHSGQTSEALGALFAMVVFMALMASRSTE